MRRGLNRLIRVCNQAALRGDVSTGIECYSNAIYGTTQVQTRLFLLGHLTSLSNFLHPQHEPPTDPDSPLRKLPSPRRKGADRSPANRSLSSPESPVRDLTGASDDVASSQEKWREYYHRGSYFRYYHFLQAAVCDFKKAGTLRAPASQIWNDMWVAALLCGNPEAMDFAVDKVKALRCDLAPLKARIRIGIQEYSQAYQAVTAAKKRDAHMFHMLAHLHFFFGDAIGAHKVACTALERTRSSSAGSSAVELFRYLASPAIPFRFNSNIVGTYLTVLSVAIYQTLSFEIVDVPLDLFIDPSIQKAWTRGEQLATPTPRTVYPPSFDPDPLDFDEVDPILHRAFVFGEILNPHSSNVRQQICLGLAYLQVMQLLETPLSVSMDNAVDAVGHWIRIYDPVAALFSRTDTPFTIFAARNGNCIKDLAPYQTRIFKMLKNGVAHGADPELSRRIRAADSIPALYHLVRSDCTAQYGSTHFFMRVGPYENFDCGIAVPAWGNSYQQRYREIDAIWCHLMLLHCAEVSPEAASDYLNSAIRWVYEFTRFVPLADGSHFIATILFHCLISSYFEVHIRQTRITAVMLQIESLLSLNFDQFRSLVNKLYPLHFAGLLDLSDFPAIATMFRSYHHRHVALYHVNHSPQFHGYFLRYMQAGLREEPPEEAPQAAGPGAETQTEIAGVAPIGEPPPEIASPMVESQEDMIGSDVVGTQST
jgi:hypothetical protein